MKELIEVKNEKGELLVSARDLFEGLGGKERFSKWITRMLGYGFEENIDYVVCTKKYTANQHGGEKELDDYALKIDMAKEICMLQKSDKGRQYRKYFLECEKKLKEQVPQLSLKEQLQLKLFSNDSMEVVNAHKELVKIEVQEATTPLLNKIEEDKPLVEFAETISQASDSIDIGTFSKLVKDQNIKIGRNKLFEWLRDNGYLMKNNVPYQKYIDNNYFEIVEYTYKTPYGEKLTTKTLITGLGQVKIIEKLRKELNS